MTDGVSRTENTGVQLTGYAQANAGFIKNAANQSYSNIGVALGGEVDYKNNYLKAEIGRGTAYTSDLEAGHRFDIGSNMGLNLSAKWQNSTSNNTTNLGMTKFNINNSVTINQDYYNAQLNTNSVTIANRNSNNIAGRAELTFGSEKMKFGVGVEGGYRTTDLPKTISEADSTIESNVVPNEAKHISVEKDCSKSNAYVTPTASAEIQLGKKLSFVADANLYEGKAGIRYTIK